MPDSSPTATATAATGFTDGLATPLQFVKGVGPRVALTLQKLGLQTVEDMLFHFPHRYEDRRNFRPLGQARHGETVCTSGEVVGVTVDRTARRGLLLTRVIIHDATGPAELVFFSQPWLKDVFNRLKGTRICVYGQVDRQSGRPTFRHPEWGNVAIDESIAMYAWHCRHHTAHIEQAIRVLRVFRLTRTQVSFTSALPRAGRVIVCPQCERILSAELGGLI